MQGSRRSRAGLGVPPSHARRASANSLSPGAAAVSSQCRPPAAQTTGRPPARKRPQFVALWNPARLRSGRHCGAGGRSSRRIRCAPRGRRRPPPTGHRRLAHRRPHRPGSKGRQRAGFRSGRGPVPVPPPAGRSPLRSARPIRSIGGTSWPRRRRLRGNGRASACRARCSRNRCRRPRGVRAYRPASRLPGGRFVQNCGDNGRGANAARTACPTLAATAAPCSAPAAPHLLCPAFSAHARTRRARSRDWPDWRAACRRWQNWWPARGRPPVPASSHSARGGAG